MENLSSKIDSASKLIEKEQSLPIIYIAGPYRGNGGRADHYKNLELAEETANILLENGFGYFCPHSNGALTTLVTKRYSSVEDYASFQNEARHQANMSICRRLLMGCDAVLLLPGWESSPGAKEEKEIAENLGIPIFTSVDTLIENKATYFSYPKQFNMLRAIHCIGFQLHREKNLDYSPYNIKATGKVGLVTRIWDKLARVMKLTGFNIGTGQYDKPITPKNESVLDTFIDLANYSSFYPIIDKGQWGR